MIEDLKKATETVNKILNKKDVSLQEMAEASLKRLNSFRKRVVFLVKKIYRPAYR